MPEREPSTPPTPEVDRAARDAEFAQRAEQMRAQLGAVFDAAERAQRDPREQLLEDEHGFSQSEPLYGQDRVAAFAVGVRELTFSSREEFIEQLMGLAQPLLHDRVYDAATRQRAEAIAQGERSQTEVAGQLLAEIHSAEWSLTLSDGAAVSAGDRVVEIHWPEDGTGPAGLGQVQDSLRAVAEVVRAHPEVKAVVGVSWMMSRGIADRLGFEKFPDVTLREGQRDSILGIASAARRDKPYQREVGAQDVGLGAMSREQFLERYG